MSKVSPSLTIAIPTYNRDKLLDKSLAALLPQVKAAIAQAKTAIRVLVVDNNSSDNTEYVLKKYAQLYSFLSFSRNPSNLGIDGNIDRCVDLAESEFIHLLSDDDTVVPGLYVQLIEFFSYSSPDFIFLNVSRPTSPSESVLEPVAIGGTAHSDNVSDRFQKVSFDNLLKSAGIWMTFISSFVVRKKSWQSVKTRKNYIGTDIYLSCVAMHMLSASRNIYISNAPWILVNAHYSGSYGILKAFLYNWLPLVSSLGKYGVSQGTIKFLERQVIKLYLPYYIIMAEKNGQLSLGTRFKAFGFLLRYPHRYTLRPMAILAGMGNIHLLNRQRLVNLLKNFSP